MRLRRDGFEAEREAHEVRITGRPRLRRVCSGLYSWYSRHWRVDCARGLDSPPARRAPGRQSRWCQMEAPPSKSSMPAASWGPASLVCAQKLPALSLRAGLNFGSWQPNFLLWFVQPVTFASRGLDCEKECPRFASTRVLLSLVGSRMKSENTAVGVLVVLVSSFPQGSRMKN